MPKEALFNDETKVGVFYAQSWALVHYLMFGQKEGTRSALTEYMTAWQNNLPAEEAFQRALGSNYTAIRDAMLDHLNAGNYNMISQPVSPRKVDSTVTRATPAAVELALAKLALGASQTDEAKVHAEALVHLDPAAPTGYDVLTWIAAKQGANDRVKATSQQAIDYGSQDPLTLVSLAGALLDEAAQQKDLPAEEATRISNLCQRALAGWPQLRAGYIDLASVLPCIAKPSAEEEELIRTGRRIFRNEGALPLCLAWLEHKRGNTEEANRLLAEALAKRESLTRRGIYYAQQLGEDWDFENWIKTLNALLAQKKNTEALNFVEHLLAGSLPTNQRWEAYRMKMKIQQAIFAENLHDAGSLMNQRKPTEALAVLDRLIAGELTDPQRVEATAKRLTVNTYVRWQEAMMIAKAEKFEDARAMVRELLTQPGLNPEQNRMFSMALKQIDFLEKQTPEARTAWLRRNAEPKD
jgi:hypothetical protein